MQPTASNYFRWIYPAALLIAAIAIAVAVFAGAIAVRDGFAKALTLLNYFHNLLVALRGCECKFDLAENQKMKARASISGTKEHIAFFRVDKLGATGNVFDIAGRHASKQGQVSQVAFEAD